ncbi:olfactory receptor 6C3-like [Leptodactylus fuscus]
MWSQKKLLEQETGATVGTTAQLKTRKLCLLIKYQAVMGNLLIIILVSTNVHLQSPMYYFLCHLSFIDLVTSTNIVPNMLGAILLGGKKMTFLCCFTQMYLFSVITECYVPPVLFYDRYLAICNLLRYSSKTLDSKYQICLSVWPWLVGLTLNLTGVFPISKFNFCHDNIIDHFYHFYCDLLPLWKLSCSDTSFIELEAFYISLPLYILPCGLIIVTYVYIFLTIYKIPSTTGKQKIFSTCSSHLIVVGTFYGTFIANYMIPTKEQSMLIYKTVSLLHTVFTPLFNPIIYSLRNQDIKMTLKKGFEKLNT